MCGFPLSPVSSKYKDVQIRLIARECEWVFVFVRVLLQIGTLSSVAQRAKIHLMSKRSILTYQPVVVIL